MSNAMTTRRHHRHGVPALVVPILLVLTACGAGDQAVAEGGAGGTFDAGRREDRSNELDGAPADRVEAAGDDEVDGAPVDRVVTDRDDEVTDGGDAGPPTLESDWSPDVVVPDPDTPVQPSLATMPLVVGRNRIAFGLIGQDGLLTSGAEVGARFYSLTDVGGGRISGELMAERSLSAIDLPQGFAHRHADGTDHDHSGPTATVYAAEIEFDRPEWWGAELLVEIDGEQLPPFKVPFRVEADTPEPAFGERVPPIEQVTTDDVDDLELIDSSDPPHPEWHDITVADALELDRPLVIAFATGAFCQTQFCGPVIEGVIGPLAERYGDEAEFIVVEPFDLAAAWNGELVPVPEMAQWGLDSEPWVFVTDADGRVAGKFQGITSLAEVGASLEAVLSG